MCSKIGSANTPSIECVCLRSRKATALARTAVGDRFRRCSFEHDVVIIVFRKKNYYYFNNNRFAHGATRRRSSTATITYIILL